MKNPPKEVVNAPKEVVESVEKELLEGIVASQEVNGQWMPPLGDG